jgi:hypothetical protein
LRVSIVKPALNFQMNFTLKERLQPVSKKVSSSASHHALTQKNIWMSPSRI